MRYLLAGIVLFCAGCGCPDAIAWKKAWGDIEPEYKTYVEKDPVLTEQDKELRRQHLILMDKVLEGVK